MSKFVVEVSGVVESRRHRTMNVYAENKDSAMVKAIDMFIKAVNKSKISSTKLSDIKVKLVDEIQVDE